MAFGTVKADALTTGTKTVLIDELVEGDSLGTAAALNVGTASGNVVQLDGQARLPAVDGSQLVNLPAGLGTVQSVALQVPSGLTISGSPIVSSGTFVVAYASGIQAFTTTESTKLQSIASGATVNSPDATLLNRANHTGTQAANTISGLATVATTGAYGDLSGLPTIPSGTVTSVALQAPSGLTVSGSPIASSGTFVVSYASGIQAFTTAESSKLASIASGATANSSDATLLNRANHTGTQPASTISGLATVATTGAYGDLSGLPVIPSGTVTNVALQAPSGFTVSGSPVTSSGTIAIAYASGFQAYTSAESSKLASVASGATANSSDVTLLNRANHTGTQAASTISGLATVATTGAYGDLSGLPSIPNGTVTSVALQAPSGFTVSGSPIVSSGTLAITYASGFQAFTSAESAKLASIASGATANNGTVTSVALSVPSGLVVSGSPIIASGELAITYASGIQAFTTNESLKLASVASGAQVNVGTDLSYSGDTRTLNSSTGSGVTLPLVSTSSAGLAPATSFSTITYGASVSLDFASLDAQYRTISLTGNLELTTSNLANGRTLVLRLVADASQRTLTFPVDWKFLGTKPANIAASKVGVLSLTAFGTTNADVVAAYAVQS